MLVSVLDELLIKGLHVESLRRSDLHAEHEPHVLFQASTIGALLTGAYEGDVTFAELAGHGNIGLGTAERARRRDDRDRRAVLPRGRGRRVNEVEPGARTPFAVVDWFEPTSEFEFGGGDGLDFPTLSRWRGRPATWHPGPSPSHSNRRSIRRVKARSVPRAGAALPAARRGGGRPARVRALRYEGSIVGFRFPDYSQGIEARRVSPALHHRRPRPRRARTRFAPRKGTGAGRSLGGPAR